MKQMIEELTLQNGELYGYLNEGSKARLLKSENIDYIAKAITHLAFRNGPVEDMHADGKLTQSNMKTLNKYMANRLAGILSAIFNNDWLKLEVFLSGYRIYGNDWDAVVPECAEMEYFFQSFCENIKRLSMMQVRKECLYDVYGA